MSLQIKNLTKSFGNRTVLRDVNISVDKAEIVFILGRSGTGKSVLLKNIVGLLKPDRGEIWLDGEEISQLSEEQYFSIRKKCGMVFQQPALFDSLSIFENIAFGLRRHHATLSENQMREKVLRSLSLVHLEENILEHKPPQISYGMQKRVSLARTVALEPSYLLFDEPTTGLDPVTTNAINNLIESLSHELHTTSLVVSHDMHCAMSIADRILVLDQGQVVANDTPKGLQASDHPLVRDFLSEVIAR